MTSTSEILLSALQEATKGLPPAGKTIECSVTACHDARFGDFQTNVAMTAGKLLGKNPRDLAQEIIGCLKVDHVCSKVEIAGAAFINFTLKPEFVSSSLQELRIDKANGILPTKGPRRVVVDFSSPNIAKSMHVGHIRSTFLGDSIARIARAVGHQVITDNHLGDWGTGFGMLIYGLKHILNRDALAASPIAEYERIYKEIFALTKTDEVVLAASRSELAKLQAGDPENLKIWKEISDRSLEELGKAYGLMGVSFDHQLGESFYNPMLGDIVAELQSLGVAQESEGAICVFFPDIPDLKDAAPMMVQKSDGAALYATTDLATLRYRVQEWKTEDIIYVTDSRQQLHFKQLFAATKRWFSKLGKTPPALHHVYFGTILGADKKPIKTKSGESIKLTELLNEAEIRALKIIQEKNPDLSPEEQRNISKVIGIGALKYADLCQNRNLDYVFEWEKLLALQGNTAPYLIYAYVRIRSIFRTAEAPAGKVDFHLATPEELAFAKHLLQFSDTVHAVLVDHRPHILTAYLYDLASKFSKFYEACPVIKAEEPTRSSRLALCDVAARTLKTGLNLLGIETLERM